MSRVARKKLLPQDAPAEGEISTGPLDEKSARFPLPAPLCWKILENREMTKIPVATQWLPRSKPWGTRVCGR